MRKILAILLSLHILLAAFMPGWEMHELVKVPYLITHFQEHRNSEQDKSFGFLDFLDMHYGEQATAHRQEQHASDNSLPFHNHHNHCHLSSIFIPATGTANVNVPANIHVKKRYKVYSQAHTSEFSFSIWQPPRFC